VSAHFPEVPFSVSKSTWDNYYTVQKGGSMNMMGHHAIGYFCRGNHYELAFEWFETDGNTEDLEITE